MKTLSRRSSFVVSAIVVALALWASAAPSMSYPLYRTDWGLTAQQTTIVFAVHPVILVFVMVIFGNISDYVGRRAAIVAGLTGELIGLLIFAGAQNIWWLIIGRVFLGIGVGLSMSAASAGVVDFSRAGREHRSGAMTTAASSVGIILAMLVGGVLVEYGPYPLRLNYLFLGVIVTGVLILSWFLPREVAPQPGRWRVTGPVVPRGARRTFIVAAASLSCSFVLGSVVLSLGGEIAKEEAGSQNAFITGLVLSLFGAAVGAVSLALAHLHGRTAALLGAVISIAGIWGFAAAGLTHSFAAFLIACAISGAGYSLSFLGGVSLIAGSVTAQHRGGVFSAGYLISYLLQGATAVGLGSIATGSSLALALMVGSIVLSVVFVLTAILAATLLKRPARMNEEVTHAEAANVPVIVAE